jgi:tetratricopeptide (TPR) repeat protein
MARFSSLLAALVVSSVLLASGEARAQTTNPLVERGQSQYDELRYEEALQTLSAALVRAGNTREDLAVIYRLLAYTYLALEREEEAAGAYRSLLAMDPDYQPGGDVSPRFREFFGAVQQQWEADGRPGLPAPSPVTISHRSPAQAERGAAIELEAQVEDPSGRVASVVLAYRHGTDDVFRRADTERRGASFVATIPGDSVRPPLVEYYFEGLDATGLPVASRGDVAAPLRVAVPAPGENILEQWWFWVGVGVIVAGGATLGILAATGAFDTTQEQGTFVITVR